MTRFFEKKIQQLSKKDRKKKTQEISRVTCARGCVKILTVKKKLRGKRKKKKKNRMKNPISWERRERAEGEIT
jgi:hypothetical protein